MDRVLLNRIELLGSIGALDSEKRSKQRYWISIEILADLREAGRSDRLEDTVDYSEVFSLAEDLMNSGDFTLVEAYAERLAERILSSQARAQSVSIEVLKPDAPIDGAFESVGIRIERDRGG